MKRDTITHPLTFPKAVVESEPVPNPLTALELFCKEIGISPVDLHFPHQKIKGTADARKFGKEYVRVLKIDTEKVWFTFPTSRTTWRTSLSLFTDAVVNGLHINAKTPPPIETELDAYCRQKGIQSCNMTLLDAGKALPVSGIKDGLVYVKLLGKSRWGTLPLTAFEACLAKVSVTTVPAVRVIWSAGRTDFPVASDPAMADIANQVHAAYMQDHSTRSLDHEDAMYGNPVRVCRKLARIARDCRLTEWAKALSANVDIFINGAGAQRSLAGYLVYLMTAQRSHPLGAPFLGLVGRGLLECETDHLIDDWHESDARTKPYFLAAKKANIGRWWG